MQQQQPKYQVAILGPDQELNFKIATNLGFPENTGKKGDTVLIENCEFTVMEEHKRDFSMHYCKMSPYEYAILVLPNPDMCRQDLSKDKTMMPHNYFYIQMLQHIQVKQILVYIDTELGKSKNDILQLEKWITEEMDRIFKGIKLNDEGQVESDKREQNPLEFDVPTIRVVSKMTLQTVNEFFKPIDRDLKRELYVLTLAAKGKIIHLKVLSGFFYTGQTLYFQGNKVKVDKIEYFDKEVIYAEEGQMVKITVKTIDKISGIGHGHNQVRKIATEMELNIVLGQIEEYEPIKKRFNKMKGLRLFMFNQKLQIKQFEATGEILDNKVINFSQNQKYYAYRVNLKNTEKTILHYPYFQGVILLESTGDIFISCFGRISKVITEDKRVPENLKQLLILPQFEKEPSPKMLYANKDGRYMCRICREQQIRSVLIECGHLRYCEDCVQSCIENKACFYCEKEVTKLKVLDNKLVAQSLYDKCEVITDPITYFKAHKDMTELPPYLQILNQLVHEEPNFKDCLCEQCGKELFTHYQICVNVDFHLNRLCKKCSVKVCGTCQQDVKTKQSIIYRFPDDPQ